MKTKFLILFVAIFIVQLYLASALTIGSVTNTPNEVQPGEQFSLTVKIENNMNQNVVNAVVSLDLSEKTPFAPYLSSNAKYIDRIDKEDSEKATFNLAVFSDAVSGTYLVPVRVSYTLGNNGTIPQNESLGMVSVIINAKPKIEVSSEGNPLIKGTEGKISLKIVNSGFGNAKFLSISVGEARGIQVTSSDKVYIGNIDSNDFDTSDFNVFVTQTSLSTISLPVEITYTDSANNQINESKVISINAYTSQEATNLGLVKKSNATAIIISVVLVIIIFFVYRSIRKRIRNKKNSSR